MWVESEQATEDVHFCLNSYAPQVSFLVKTGFFAEPRCSGRF